MFCYQIANKLLCFVSLFPFFLLVQKETKKTPTIDYILPIAIGMGLFPDLTFVLLWLQHL